MFRICCCKNDHGFIAKRIVKLDSADVWHFDIQEKQVNRMFLKKIKSFKSICKYTLQFEKRNFCGMRPDHLQGKRFVVNRNGSHHIYNIGKVMPVVWFS